MEKMFIWDEVIGEIFIDEIGTTNFNSAIKEGMKRWDEMPTADKKRRIRYEVCSGEFDEEGELDFDTVDVLFTIKGDE